MVDKVGWYINNEEYEYVYVILVNVVLIWCLYGLYFLYLIIYMYVCELV